MTVADVVSDGRGSKESCATSPPFWGLEVGDSDNARGGLLGVVIIGE